MIEGVFIKSLDIVPNEKGDVMHMMRCDAPFFKQFGEVYFSCVNPGFIKGWKKHFRQTQHFVVPVGDITLVLYDARDGSPTKGEIQEISIGIQNYQLVRIPPEVWYGFRAEGREKAMIANCTDMPYHPDESVNLEILDKSIPYSWGPEAR